MNFHILGIQFTHREIKVTVKSCPLLKLNLDEDRWIVDDDVCCLFVVIAVVKVGRSTVCVCLRLPVQWRRTGSMRTRDTSPEDRPVRASLILTPPPTPLLLLLVRVLALPPWPSLTPPTAQTWVSARRACLRALSPGWMNWAARPGRTAARCPLP